MNEIRKKILERKLNITQNIEKAFYKDNPENKRLHRVGKKYGGEKRGEENRN